MIRFIKSKLTSIKYILSGLLKVGSQIIAGFIVFRWLEPEKIGEWQSIALFASYFNFLTLGSVSGLNRDLPFLLGKGEKDKAMRMLQSVGFYINFITGVLLLISIFILLSLHYYDIYSPKIIIMIFIMVLMGVMGIQSSFYGATYRSANSFNKLSKIQTINIFLNFIIIPLVFVFNIWGYILANFLISAFIFTGYYYYRPYKIAYKRNDTEFKEVVKSGFVIYIWNYLFSMLKTVPRLVLVFFGTPMMVGLFSPAGTINGALLQLPNYINSYIFPKMNFKFGKSNNPTNIFKYTITVIKYLSPALFVFALVLSFIIPFVFRELFPKYIDGIIPAQIFIFISVFYSINMVLHNGMYSIRKFDPFIKIMLTKILSVAMLIAVIYFYNNDLLIAVSIGSLISEALLSLVYLYYFKKSL